MTSYEIWEKGIKPKRIAPQILVNGYDYTFDEVMRYLTKSYVHSFQPTDFSDIFQIDEWCLVRCENRSKTIVKIDESVHQVLIVNHIGLHDDYRVLKSEDIEIRIYSDGVIATSDSMNIAASRKQVLYYNGLHMMALHLYYNPDTVWFEYQGQIYQVVSTIKIDSRLKVV